MVFSIRNAVAVAALAITAELYFNRGQTIRSVVSAIFGNGANAQANSLKYRVIAHPFHDYKNEDASLNKALKKVQENFPEEYRKLVEKEKLSSEENILIYFKDKCSLGVCSGVTNALFDKIHRKESRSLKESVPLLNFEEIFYHHILQYLCTQRKSLDSISQFELFRKKIELNDKNILLVTENLSSKTLPSIERKSDEEWAEVKKQIRAQLENDLIHVGKDYHTSMFTESDEFLVESDLSTYQKFFKTIIRPFPDQADFAGCLHIQNHLLAFQYGKSGYYLYDSFNADKGLFEYPDSGTFFWELKKHAVEDVIYVKGQIISKENPNLASKQFKADVQEKLKKAKVYFGARPLSQINS